MASITSSSKKVYDCLLQYGEENGGMMPTQLQIADSTGYSISTVNLALKRLEIAGLIVRSKKAGRQIAGQIQITGAEWSVENEVDIEPVMERVLEAKNRMAFVYEFIVAFKATYNGCAPSVRDIGRGLGQRFDLNNKMASTSVVGYYLDELEIKGKIERVGGGITRMIMLPEEGL